MQWSSVLLPAPDGPTMPTISPSSIVEVDAAQDLERAPHVANGLLHVARGDDGLRVGIEADFYRPVGVGRHGSLVAEAVDGPQLRRRVRRVDGGERADDERGERDGEEVASRSR